MFSDIKKLNKAIVVLGLLTVVSCTSDSETPLAQEKQPVVTVNNTQMLIDFDELLHSRVRSVGEHQEVNLSDYHASEYVKINDRVVTDFRYSRHDIEKVVGEFGEGETYHIWGESAEGLVKNVNVSIYADYPSLAIYQVSYTNASKEALSISQWVNNAYQINRLDAGGKQQAASFWAYQGASYSDRRDWVLPITPGFEQQNYMGMNASDYGSGTPITDLWQKDLGIAVGHIETTPKLVSLPVSFKAENTNQADMPLVQKVDIGVEYERTVVLAPNDTLTTFNTFVNVHQGDYYQTLITYRSVMAQQGLKSPEFPDTSYEPIWCAWGYERGFNVDEILETLPKAKELGLTWAVLDDGWQTAEGDWYLHPEKFPEGDASMQNFVKSINDAGLKAKLWWAPLAVDPGTDLLHEHSDMLLLDENGAAVDVTWWNSFYLCPAYAKTIAHSKALVKKIMSTWGYSGLKIDGQHLNGVPPCYNPKHNHARPEESVEALQDYWKMIYETAQEIDKESVVEICPCGTSYAFHNMPYMNQAVSSDPLTSWQVRLKGKTLKGLMGDSSPYYGDHVELSDNANDFASSVGIGAIVGTKFTWPKDKHPELGFTLTPEKEKIWQHWIDIYKDKMLPKGVYLGQLYDIAFDKPETHAISKDALMYYAFYAPSWSGKLTLKGLTKGTYQVSNYVNGDDLGEIMVEQSSAVLDLDFNDYLLLEVTKIEK